MDYPSGSTVLSTDIGEGAAALNCTTDSTTCCTNMNGETRAGEFFFPDGTQVLIAGNTAGAYYRSRGSKHISLHRRSNIPTQPTGQFRCEIPDASGTTRNLFINIGMLKALCHSINCVYYVSVTFVVINICGDVLLALCTICSCTSTYNTH